MKQKLAIVTGNPLKFRELEVFLKDYFGCEQIKISDGYEIQGTPEEIITHKLNHAYDKIGMPVLVDDTSLHFEILGGFPGPYAKGFFECLTPYEMGKRFAGSKIEAICRLGIMYDKDDVLIGQGSVKGVIIEPKDNNHGGREFDIFLLPEGMDKPMIEFSPEEKNKFSHRGNALRDLIEKLNQRGI